MIKTWEEEEREGGREEEWVGGWEGGREGEREGGKEGSRRERYEKALK